MPPRRSLPILLSLALCSLPAPADPPRLDRQGDPLPPGAIARLGTVRFRHHGHVLCAVFSPDGKTLTSFGSDDVIRVWDVSTGKQLRGRRWHGKRGEVPFHATFSPDGKLLVMERLTEGGLAAGAQGVLADVRTGKELMRFPAPRDIGGYTGFTFSADGKLLAAESVEGGIQLWETARGKKVRRLHGDMRYRTLTFSPNGKVLVGAHDGDTLQFWDTRTGKALRELKGDYVHHPLIAFAPDGKTLATVHRDQAIRLRDAETMKIIREFHPTKKEAADFDSRSVNSLSFTPNGQTLIARYRYGTIVLWDVKTGKRRLPFRAYRIDYRGHEPDVMGSPDGKFLIAWADQGAIRLWDAATGKERIPADLHQDTVNSVALMPDGRHALTASCDGTLARWDLARQRPVWQRPVGQSSVPGAMTLSPDATMLAVIPSVEKLHVLRTATGKEITPKQEDIQGFEAVFAPDGHTFAVADGSGVQLRDMASGKVKRAWEVKEGMVVSLAWSASGALLATGAAVGQMEDPRPLIRLWDLSGKRKMPVFVGKQSWIASLTFSSDDRVLLASMEEDTFCTWEVATGQERWSSRGWKCACLSPNRRLIALGNKAGAVVLWDVVAGKELRRLRGHGGSIEAVAFSADSKRLISGSTDSTALVWDVAGLLPATGTQQRLSAKALALAWEDLSSANAVAAFRAIRILAAAPQQAVLYLRERLRPFVFDAQQVQRWLADLDSPRFVVRRRAEEELERLGQPAEPALRQRLRGRISLEVRRRAERLLGLCEQSVPPAPILRQIRAIEVLEMTATPEARRLLEGLAGGAPEVRLTREARAAVRRLPPQATRP